jgi:uncharacterized protein (DUF2147 family)
MKQTLLIIILSGFLFCRGTAQDGGDRIIGKWLKLPKKDLIIEMYKSKKAYNGRISWTKPGDDKPVGYVIIQNLRYDPKTNRWEHGKIHDPNSSRTYSAEVKLDDDGELIVKGYMGTKLFSSSRTFTRVENASNATTSR